MMLTLLGTLLTLQGACTGHVGQGIILPPCLLHKAGQWVGVLCCPDFQSSPIPPPPAPAYSSPLLHLCHLQGHLHGTEPEEGGAPWQRSHPQASYSRMLLCKPSRRSQWVYWGHRPLKRRERAKKGPGDSRVEKYSVLITRAWGSRTESGETRGWGNESLRELALELPLCHSVFTGSTAPDQLCFQSQTQFSSY